MARRRFGLWLLPLLAAGAIGCGLGARPAGTSEQTSELILSTNGLSIINGLGTSNGLSSNGLATSNGLGTSNGLATSNGLGTSNGLSSTGALMSTVLGRMTVRYLVRCALAEGDSLTKQDQYGVSYTFPGQLGLAPAWKTGACDSTCQQAMSACMLAHVNTTGVHIPLWLVSPNAAIGWGTDPQYPNREGSFFGNIFTPNASSGLVDAFYCNGPGFSTDVVPGRLGALQTGAPYTDPYTSASDPAGNCAPCYSTRADGPTSCKADGVNYGSPITVWRGQTFQAESATLSNGPSVVTCSPGVCSNGARVGYIGPYSTVTFKNVFSAKAGAHTLIVYYADGDACLNDACPRYFDISVNGGAQQVWAFPVVKGGNWNVIAGMPIALTGFVAGANTIVFKGDATHAAPDLDWIEVE